MQPEEGFFSWMRWISMGALKHGDPSMTTDRYVLVAVFKHPEELYVLGDCSGRSYRKESAE